MPCALIFIALKLNPLLLFEPRSVIVGHEFSVSKGFELRRGVFVDAMVLQVWYAWPRR